MRYFCTYFDHRYLPQGLAMYESLKKHCADFTLWVLCFDQKTYDPLRARDFSDLRPIRLEDFERGDEKLQRAKSNRSQLEYYFTCTPSLPLFVFRNHPEVDLITYLDADLLFFSDVDPIFEEMGSSSIAIIAHRFLPQFREAECYGIFNVGWVSFRRDENGLGALEWWRQQCFDYCGEETGAGKFADQKYLDDWPNRFEGVTVLKNKGANVAPWNLARYHVSTRNGNIYVDDELLIFFHFHGLRRLNGWLYDTHLQHYGARMAGPIIRKIYRPYLRRLQDLTAEQGAREISGPKPLAREKAPGHFSSSSMRRVETLKRLLRRHYLFVVQGRAL
jgi:hypothetical protein